jgi:hypothetical protein
MPNFLLPSCLSRLVVSHCQVIQTMIGHVVKLPFTCLPSTRGDGLWIISSTSKCITKWSLPMSVKALWLLWLEKGANDAKGKGSHHTAKHKKAQRWDTGTSSVVIPPEMMECLNKMEWKQIKLLVGNKKLALYYAWGEAGVPWESEQDRETWSSKDVRFWMCEAFVVWKQCTWSPVTLMQVCTASLTLLNGFMVESVSNGGEMRYQEFNLSHLSSLYWKYQDLPTITVTWISLVLHVIVIVGKLISADCLIVG